MRILPPVGVCNFLDLSVRRLFIFYARRSVVAFVEELLARDLVVLDRVEGDFFQREALAAGLTGDVQGEIDRELALGIGAAAEERPAHFFAMEGVDLGPVPGFLDD